MGISVQLRNQSAANAKKTNRNWKGLSKVVSAAAKRRRGSRGLAYRWEHQVPGTDWQKHATVKCLLSKVTIIETKGLYSKAGGR